MRKTAAILLAALLLGLLTACSGKPGGTATPGDLSPTTTPRPIGEGTERTDVSGAYAPQLCSGAWMDTDSMEYYVFHRDGGFDHMQDEDLAVKLASGVWHLYRDEQDRLTLVLREDGSDADWIMYEFELYETSFYASSETGFSYIFLLGTEED